MNPESVKQGSTSGAASLKIAGNNLHVRVNNVIFKGAEKGSKSLHFYYYLAFGTAWKRAPLILASWSFTTKSAGCLPEPVSPETLFTKSRKSDPTAVAALSSELYF